MKHPGGRPPKPRRRKPLLSLMYRHQAGLAWKENRIKAALRLEAQASEAEAQERLGKNTVMGASSWHKAVGWSKRPSRHTWRGSIITDGKVGGYKDHE